MPTARNHDFRGSRLGPELAQRLRRLPSGAAVLSLGLALACASCEKSATQVQKPPPEVEVPAPEMETPAGSNQTAARKPATREGYATWYNVPANSLTKRRAASDELTAAHVRLPLGTLVRVTHLANGKSVIVRITDRCVPRHQRVTIDLSREAAEKLEMISEGSTRVRIEVLPDEKGTATVPDSTSSNAHP